MEREIPEEWIRLALEQPDLREADRITRGFRNFCHYQLAADLEAGGLNLQATDGANAPQR
jgi:hypothetical protein